MSGISAAHQLRMADLDPALRSRELPAGQVTIDVPGVVGGVRVEEVDPDSSMATYGALHQHHLMLRWDGTAGALADALEGYLADHADVLRQPDTSVNINWAARDVNACREFVRAGFEPAATIALRPAGHTLPDASPSVVVRRAGPADVEAVVRLHLADVDYDGAVGAVTRRPSSEPTARADLTASLAADEPWIWVAEVDGLTAAVVSVQKPDAAAWIAPVVTVERPAYLALGSVAEGQRGTGLGTAVAAVALRHLDAEGVPACLLHYGTLNPLSVPFWSRLGFRPLLRGWRRATPPT